MAGGLSVPRSLVWGLIGSAGYGFSQWVLIAMIARGGPTSLVGQFSLALAIAAPLQMAAHMQLANLLSTDVVGEFSDATYLRLRWVAMGVMTGPLLLAAGALEHPSDRLILFLVWGSKFVEAFSDIHYGLFLRHHRMDLVARSQLLRAAIGISGFYLALHYAGGLPSAVAALMLAWCTVLVVHDRPLGRAMHTTQVQDRHAGVSGLTQLLRQAAPLGVVAALISVNVSVPRLVLESHFGKSALGLFAAMASLIVAGRLLLLPLVRTLTPRLAEGLARRDFRAFKRTLRHGLVGAALLGFGGIGVAAVGGVALLSALFGPAYGVEPLGFLALMIAAGFGYLATVLQEAATSVRVIRPQVLVLLAALIVTAALASLRIPVRGVLGACEAVAGGALAELLGSAALLRWSTAQIEWHQSPESDP